VVTHQLQVERRTGKVRRPETDVLPLCHATNYRNYMGMETTQFKKVFILAFTFCRYLVTGLLKFAFSALTLLAGDQKVHRARKN